MCSACAMNNFYVHRTHKAISCLRHHKNEMCRTEKNVRWFTELNWKTKKNVRKARNVHIQRALRKPLRIRITTHFYIAYHQNQNYP